MTPEQFREADNAIRGALRNAKKYQDFEDIYQDSWVYLLRRLDKFDDSQGRLGTWAYTTAKWIYSTRYKYMARRRKMHVPLDYGLSYTAQDETVENQQVWAALGLMQQRYQTMLIHAHVYDYPRRTIAENLGVSLRTVEKYMQVAKKQFRENMSA